MSEHLNDIPNDAGQNSISSHVTALHEEEKQAWERLLRISLEIKHKLQEISSKMDDLGCGSRMR